MRFPLRPVDLRGTAVRAHVSRRSEEGGDDDKASSGGDAPDPAKLAAKLAAANAEVEKLRAHKEKLEADVAKNRDAKRSALADAEAKAREHGEYKALAESLEAQLTEARKAVEDLPTLQQKAARLDEIIKAEEAAVSAKIEKLAPEQRAILEDIPDVFRRRRHLETLVASGVDAAAVEKKKDPSGGGAPTGDGKKKYTDMTSEEKLAFHRQPVAGVPRSSMRGPI